MSNLNSAPRSVRLHIGLFGTRNSGKSTLLNAITGHSTSVVSPVAGTTTDPVYKAIELYGIGPCVLIDTAGFDDEGELGNLRIGKTEDAFKKTDVAVLLFPVDSMDHSKEFQWADKIIAHKKPLLAVISKSDLDVDVEPLKKKIKDTLKLDALVVSSSDKNTQHSIREALIRLQPERDGKKSIVDGLVEEGDVVMLVMPQQINAPQGRLILPQVQTTRDLLDHKCIIISVTADEMEDGMSHLKEPPKLIITDSQVFPYVYERKPKESRLTSFSVLMAGVKGDIEAFARGASAIEQLKPTSKVLIAEACTHAPLTEDIGRVQIPRLLRQKISAELQIDMVSGTDFPDDLSTYDLVIHCAGCMFNRSYMMSRLKEAKSQSIPMTNYGITLAQLSGILDKIEL
ncbi:MAG: [FeFe] hydrogenase H-cluster maturation GTPase HydF [Sphaerochaeta sp.]